MASKANICSMALGLLGCAAVNDIDNPSNEQERTCLLWWNTVRDSVLKAVAWRFAGKRVQLSATTTPAFEYAYAFQLPTDYLKVRGLWDEENEKWITDKETDTDYQYEIENTQLLTNQDTAYLSYTARIENTGLYPIKFIECMTLLMAAQMAPKLATDGKPKRNELLGDYGVAIKEATDEEQSVNYFIDDSQDAWLECGGFQTYESTSADDDTIFSDD